MAPIGAGIPSSAKLLALLEKAKGVSHDLAAHPKTEKTCCSFTRNDNPFGFRVPYVEIDSDSAWAHPQDWDSILETIGAKFTVDWSRENNRYSRQDLRMLRLGDQIFKSLHSRGFNPEWNGERVGDMTITAVDEAGVNLAMAMALHPRLGADSRLSLVSSLPPPALSVIRLRSLRLSMP
jgi:hypothetical protein